jgi:hypothetical protein
MNDDEMNRTLQLHDTIEDRTCMTSRARGHYIIDTLQDMTSEHMVTHLRGTNYKGT